MVHNLCKLQSFTNLKPAAIWAWFPELAVIPGFGYSEVTIIYPDILVRQPAIRKTTQISQNWQQDWHLFGKKPPIQTLSEKVLNPPNYSKLYPKHFPRRYLDP
jgi:hypothetical protein